MSVQDILKTHPRPPIADLAVLVRCIDECGECEATCTICADASSAEDDVRTLVRCISLCLDCADTCDSTRRVLSRQTDPDPAVKRTCGGGLPGRVPSVRRGVRAPRPAPRALPPLRGGVPSLREHLPGSAHGAQRLTDDSGLERSRGGFLLRGGKRRRPEQLDAVGPLCHRPQPCPVGGPRSVRR